MKLDIKRILEVTSIILLIFIVFFISLAYFGYIDLKKTLIVKLADKSTSLIGQRVDVGDLAFSPSGGVSLHNISIKNPRGFDSGQLLYIKRLYVKLKYSELFRGRFYFKNIAIFSPELTVIKDRNGRLNISDKLMLFLTKKSTLKYQVDELDIDSGIVDFNKDERYMNSNIDLHLKNLSSDPGAKTLIKGHTSYAEGNMVRINGWAYLKGEPKRFNVSISSDDFSLSAFREFFNKYKINAERAKINLKFNTEGDSVEGFNFKLKIQIKGAGFIFYNKEIKVKNFDLYMNLSTGKESILGDFSFSTRKIMFQGITSGLISGSGRFDEKDFFVDIPGAEISGGRINLAAMGKTSKGPFPVKIKATAENIDLGVISRAASKFSEFPYSISGDISSAIFEGVVNSADSLSGNASVKARKISVLKADSKRNILKDVSLNSEIKFEGNDFEFKADASTGNIFTSISGIVKRFEKKDRSVEIKANLPEVKVTDIRDSFWDIFPDSLLYAGLDGSISSDVSIDYSNSGLTVNGELMLKDVLLEGENREYSVGPINGLVPIAYAKTDSKQKTIKMPSFERSEFDNLYKSYSQETIADSYNRLTIGSLSYGFRFLENINVWIKQNGSVLNIGQFNGNIFGGRLNGSATIDISNGLNYRVGILLKGLSLTKLCDGIEPIKGYISGKVDGIANLKGPGVGISQLIGKADFWAYSTDDEKTKISREFLHKIGGPSIKRYLGDRRFDKGIMSLYLQNGFAIFKELEISNRNFIGITDLSVKVMPFNNRISIDHLTWTIIEAAQRAKVK